MRLSTWLRCSVARASTKMDGATQHVLAEDTSTCDGLSYHRNVASMGCRRTSATVCLEEHATAREHR